MKTKTVIGKRPPLKLPFMYETTRDFKIVNLEPDGILCIPVLGMSDYHGPRERAPEHTHPECIEIFGGYAFVMRAVFGFGDCFAGHPAPRPVFAGVPQGVSPLEAYASHGWRKAG